jgi:hypothetical protein
MAKLAKARVNAKSIPWLLRIYDGVINGSCYLLSDEALAEAPSDILDGHAYPHEVADLVRRHILYVIPIPKCDRVSDMMPVTWRFTERGIAIMRAWIAAKPIPLPEVYPEHSCPNCGAPIPRPALTQGE